MGFISVYLWAFAPFLLSSLVVNTTAFYLQYTLQFLFSSFLLCHPTFARNITSGYEPGQQHLNNNHIRIPLPSTDKAPSCPTSSLSRPRPSPSSRANPTTLARPVQSGSLLEPTNSGTSSTVHENDHNSQQIREKKGTKENLLVTFFVVKLRDWSRRLSFDTVQQHGRAEGE